MSKILKLIISIAVPLVVGAISGLFTVSEISGWYQTINKPSWNPPSWIFAPVWTTMYIMMGIALYLVWVAAIKPAMKKTAIALFVIQLLLNFFWSFIFFKQHQIGLAFVEIIIMFVCIVMTIFSFARINKAAAWLLVSYISWVSFATILTYMIWQLNK